MSPELAFQGAIVDRLKTEIAGIAQRIYDRVPPDAVSPYISIGPADVAIEAFNCFTTFAVTQQIDVWSVKPGFAECKFIAAQVRAALHEYEATRDGFTFEIRHEITREFRDPDGLTSHAAISLTALIDIEPA